MNKPQTPFGFLDFGSSKKEGKSTGRTQLERFGGVKSRDREKEDLQAKSRGFIMVTIDLRVGQFGGSAMPKKVSYKTEIHRLRWLSDKHCTG